MSKKNSPKPLKIGIVCEGQKGCAEVQVFPKLVELICPHTVCSLEIVPSGNRPNVLTVAPTVAKRLLIQGCQFVFVIWDVFPEWRDQGGTTDCTKHVEKLKANLLTARLSAAPIIPIAIREELEAWLLCDADALIEVIKPQKKGVIQHERDPDNVSAPKTKLKELFKLGRGKIYNDTFSAGQIASRITSTTRLRRSQSFSRFEDALSHVCESK